MQRTTGVLYAFALLFLVLTAAPAYSQESSAAASGPYVCPPCGCAGDTIQVSAPGKCAHCGMSLILLGSTKTVVVLLFDGVETLDFAGPVEVFAADMGHFDVITVAKTAAPVTTGHGGLTVTPSRTFADCPKADIFVVPGGGVGGIIRDAEAMEFVRAKAGEAEIALSVCSGAFILGHAGLLDGLKATAHEGDIAELRAELPDVTVVNARYVDNGKIITAGGVSAGIDAALHVIERFHSKDRAQEIAEYLQHAWRTE